MQLKRWSKEIRRITYIKARETVRLPKKQKELNRSNTHWVIALGQTRYQHVS
jgi:hypothetical protein